MNLAYCDYIVEQCRSGILNEKTGMDLIQHCTFPKFDLHPTEGYFISTRKTLTVTDVNGKKYKVIVEEID